MSHDAPNPYHADWEHQEPWPSGRVNHFLFDLNRDWAWATQVETQHRLKLYHEWMPQVHVDVHEQYPDNPYYFAPAAEPFHSHISPFQVEFQNKIGEANAKNFDKHGWLYFTKEIFDLLYPSYGDTYPTFNGSVGMTYEQAGHGISGRQVLLQNSDTLMLRDRIDHHTESTLSTIMVAAESVDELRVEFEKYFELSRKNPPGEYKSFVISHNNSPKKIERIKSFLELHNIKYGYAKSKGVVEGLSYFTGRDTTWNLNKDDLIISAFQEMGVLAQVLFEPEPKLDDSLTYDITAWALPYAHGLKALAVMSNISLVSENKSSSLKTSDFIPDAYAYAMRWQDYGDAKALAKILNSGVRVRYASKSFSVAGHDFDRGTIVALTADNNHLPNWYNIMKEAKPNLVSLKTGYMDLGPDFGSDKYKLIKKPHVAILAGTQTDPYALGYAWHYFERDIVFQPTIVDASLWPKGMLNDYNVIVMSDGEYTYTEADWLVIEEWIKKGGKLIALGAANEILAKNCKNLGLKVNKTEVSEATVKVQYEDKERQEISNFIPGAIFSVDLDESHPLAFGIGKTYFSLKTNTTSIAPIKNGGWTVGSINDKPQYVGFCGYNALQKVKNSVVAGEKFYGNGKVVCLVDNPLFRGFWDSGKLLFSNALFFD